MYVFYFFKEPAGIMKYILYIDKQRAWVVHN